MQFVDYQTHQRIVDFMYRVYGWMSVGLTVTAAIAYGISTSPALTVKIATNPGIVIALLLLQVGLVIGLSAFITKMSPASAAVLFVAYAASVGVTLSSIFLVYSLPSIYATFFITAGMFMAMAIYGYLTKTDLTQIGNIMVMAVFGLVIGLVVNMFWQNSSFDLLLSAVGVFVFTVLTAYDTQKIKQLGENMVLSGQSLPGVAIIGALTLYLDFINLFLFLLRILGQQRQRD